MNKRSVVIPWDAGEYIFRWRWQAALCRYIMRRWTGWAALGVLTHSDRKRAIKPIAGKRTRRWV